MKKYYIKERHNPQFKKPYYVAYGKITKKSAESAEKTRYGYNSMLPFDTKKQYEAAIEKYKSEGFNVYNS